MSELISGKEALIALANGEEVELMFNYKDDWNLINKNDAYAFNIFLDERGIKFRLKPRTITINEIEVPAPFKPKEGEIYYFLSSYTIDGFDHITNNSTNDTMYLSIGAWRTEEEIKQVVAALRSTFNK